MKISKVKTKYHNQAVALVESDKPLTLDERLFVAEHWNPAAEHNVGVSGTFFTPMPLARELQIETSSAPGRRILDLCAGTGRLSLHVWIAQQQAYGPDDKSEIVCIENNPTFVAVGKRILPEATWIRADAFDQKTYEGLGHFDEVISNPPYGLNPKNGWLHKAPSQYMAAEIAMKLADRAVFLLAQGDCPFRFSSAQYFERVENKKYEKFSRKTGVQFEMNCGIDTTVHTNSWVGTKILTEIVLVSKTEEDTFEDMPSVSIPEGVDPEVFEQFACLQ